MSQTRWRWGARGLVLTALLGCLAVVAVPRPGTAHAAAGARTANELPVEFRYIPADAAYFIYADATALWGHPIVKSVRKADQSFVEELVGKGKGLFGLTPEDVKSVVVFSPSLKSPRDLEKFGVVATFKTAYDKAKLRKGAEQMLGKNATVSVVPVNDRTALVLVNLGDKHAKPQPADATGPLTAALQEAARDKHAAVGGLTLANLPDELRADNVPAAFRPFQPLFKATSITATLDLGKTIDLDVRVKTGTAAQAIDCEKSLGMLLGLIQDTLGEGMKEFDKSKDPLAKDFLALLKAGIATAKNAQFSTLGNETRVSVSIPSDLPFANAFLVAKRKATESAASASSANNLKQIALSMHAYHDTHGTLPPAAVCDKTGKPLLSWRVLVLPYVEEDKLFKEFKLDEPWDSEHNKKLLAKMPKVYAIPGLTKPGATDTHYRVFVGNGAGFDWIMGHKLPDFTDGTSNTLMCVTAETAVPWSKPDELEFDPDKDMTRLVGRVVNGRFQFAMCDGSVRTLDKIPPKDTLKALITRGGGEVVPDDFDR